MGIKVSVNHQERRVDLLDVNVWTVAQISLQVFPGRHTHALLLRFRRKRPRHGTGYIAKAITWIETSVETQQIRKAGHRHGSLEPVCLSDEAVNTVTAIAVTHETDAFRIGNSHFYNFIHGRL